MIIPMKKARIVVLKEDENILLNALQKQAILMPIALDETKKIFPDDPFLQRAQNSLSVLKKYHDKPKLGSELIYTYEEFTQKNDEQRALVEQIELLVEEKRILLDKTKDLKSELNELSLWRDLDIKLNEFDNLLYSVAHFALIPKYSLEKLQAIVSNKASELILLGSDVRHQAFVVVTYYEDDQALVDELKAISYSEVFFPKVDKFIKDIIGEKEVDIRTTEAKLNEIEESLVYLGKKVNDIQLLIDQINSELAQKRTPLVLTLDTVYLEGWVRSDEVDKLSTLLQDTLEVYDVDYVEAAKDETPPTALKNNRFTKIFEPITNTFSVPSTSELDPNPVMAPWYWILFGMMMGDVGYGAVMLILFGILIKVMKPKEGTRSLMMMLMICGVTTIIWGVLFGSYFGVTWHPILVEPMNDPMKMLLISMAVGAFHIITGLIFKGYQLIINKKYLDAVADSLSWILVLLGIGLYLIGLQMVGIIVAALGLVIVLFTAGREKSNIFAKIGGGFTGLYGITSYVSDIISYSRILALGLSTASISFVMNLMAGMFSGAMKFIVGPIILILGHSLNLIMSLLSAYVHTGRLQYIEFYGKFYEGNGYLFNPLSLQLKYVDKVQQNNIV